MVLPVFSNLLVCLDDLKVDANSANFNLRCNDYSRRDLIEYLEGVSVYCALIVGTIYGISKALPVHIGG